jgi:GH25 family lysozyme M1 (1,4-beta-N-acetylmuramidase)
LRRWLLAIGVVLILSFLAYFFYNNIKDYYKSYYECEGVNIDNKKYTVFGIDVSSHQDEIDWENLTKSEASRIMDKYILVHGR